ncbi:FAD-dependent oxidoreductase [Palleronia sp. THAF1]|uniref:FAD-dependent oxidoreductase n=1 Tax=Palleronia sp. THAF1 TaxID=2587842 RepID=UPI001C12AD80|nr:FAD-dependent oxidoreductase [Palleronia sp. THAF1]
MDEILIIGAGPSGLAAALALRDAGLPVRVVERGDRAGGLMRSPRFDDCIVDLGRKELYARFPQVDALWNDLLGDEYRPYPHRVGSLFGGRIIEMSGRYRGPARGMPPAWLVRGGIGLAAGWTQAALRSPRTYEEHWHGRVGPHFARVLAQGYWEKFRGQGWADMPPPVDASRRMAAAQALRMARRGGMAGQKVWRHPLRGTGQLFEALAARVTARGGRIDYGAEVLALVPEPDGGVTATIRQGRAVTMQSYPNVISGLAVERLWSLLPVHADAAPVADPSAQRAVLLVYLLLDGPPAFPHAWLEVNDTKLKAGRVVNYAAFGGDMVPQRRTALCVEFFLAGNDPLFDASEDAQIALAMTETAGAGLIDRSNLTGAYVLRLDRTNAAASWREQQTSTRTRLFEKLRDVPAIYHVNRPGADWATLAGMQAARSIIVGDRDTFDRDADPTRRQEDGSTAA